MAEEKKYTGYGTCTFANGEYTGELVDGVRQGYGVFKFSNYDIYDGDWEAGKMHGKGIYKFYDPIKDKYASKYEGDFNNGMREGKGKMTYANHDVYVGSWQKTNVLAMVSVGSEVVMYSKEYGSSTNGTRCIQKSQW